MTRGDGLFLLKPRARRAADCSADLSLGLGLNGPRRRQAKVAARLERGLALSSRRAKDSVESSPRLRLVLSKHTQNNLKKSARAGYAASVSSYHMSIFF